MFQQTKSEWQFEVMQKIKKAIRKENEIWHSVMQVHSPTKRAVDLGWTCAKCGCSNIESDLLCGFCDTPRPSH